MRHTYSNACVKTHSMRILFSTSVLKHYMHLQQAYYIFSKSTEPEGGSEYKRFAKVLFVPEQWLLIGCVVTSNCGEWEVDQWSRNGEGEGGEGHALPPPSPQCFPPPPTQSGTLHPNTDFLSS